MQVFCIMSTAFYLLILLVIIKQYRKVKLHREYYDSMEEIYCCEPSLRNLDKVNRNVVIDRYSLAHVITVVIGGDSGTYSGLNISFYQVLFTFRRRDTVRNRMAKNFWGLYDIVLFFCIYLKLLLWF